MLYCNKFCNLKNLIKMRAKTFRHYHKLGKLENETNSQQPKVIACQGGGEMFKTRLSNPTRADEVGNSSQNPPADACPYQNWCNVRIVLGKETCSKHYTERCETYKYYERYKKCQ